MPASFRAGRFRYLPSLLSSVLLLLLIATTPAGAWHSFAEREIAPDIPGTSIVTEFITFPENAMMELAKASLTHKCTIAYTSILKALEVCKNTKDSCGVLTACSGRCLACAGSLHSAVRDAYDLIGTSCQEMEENLNKILPPYLKLLEPNMNHSSWTSDLTFSQMDFELVKNNCKKIMMLWSSTCNKMDFCDPSVAPHGVEGAKSPANLAPSRDECPNFAVQSEGDEYSFLTWALLRTYTLDKVGCAGGLKDLTESEEYKSWACVYQPDCTEFARDDMACFKYNKLRGEFHFWGWNSMLGLHPPLFQVQYSLCYDGKIAWKDTTTGDVIKVNQSGVILPISIQIRIKNELSVPGETVHMFDSVIPGLGQDGCEPFSLRENTDYWLDINIGVDSDSDSELVDQVSENYYSWSGWWSSGVAMPGVAAETLEMTLNPKPQYDPETCTRGKFPNDPRNWMLFISLAWCAEEQIDLDLYFVNNDGQKLVWWGNTRIQGNYTASLDLDDQGLDQETLQRSFGPETITVRGSLPPGQWRVMANAFPTLPNGKTDQDSPAEDFAFKAQCAQVNFYTATEENILASVKMNSPGSSPGERTNWWHILTLHVSEFDGTVSYVVVDKFVTGPDPRKLKFDRIPTVTAPPPGSRKIVRVTRDGKRCFLFYTLGLVVRHATALEFVEGTFKVDCTPTCPACCNTIYPLSEALQQFDPIRSVVTGGIQLVQSTEPGHEYRVEVFSDGFANNVFTFNLKADRIFKQDVYMIPQGGGSSFIVLNWGDRPRDLDIYLFPVRIRNEDPANKPKSMLGLGDTAPDPEGLMVWHANPENKTSSVFPALANKDRYGIRSKESYVSWETTRLQYLAASSDPNLAYVGPKFPCVGGKSTCISLARDDYSHGILIGGFISNGPEIASLTNLKKGKYRFFINVFAGPWDDDYDDGGESDSSEFENSLTVDIWMGNSVDTVIMIEQMEYTTPGGKWLYAGYLQVVEKVVGSSSCEAGVYGTGFSVEQKSGSGLCNEWYTVNKLAILDPRRFNNFNVTLRFQTVPTPITDIAVTKLHTAKWTAYRGGTCSCISSLVCSCTGNIFDIGRIGRYNTEGIYQINDMPFYFEEGMYWMVFSLDGYYERAVQIQVEPRDMRPEELPVVVLLSMADAGGARVLLNSGASNPALVHHDLFLVSTNAARDRVVWNYTRTYPNTFSPEFQISSASADLITFSKDTRNLKWAIVVSCEGCVDSDGKTNNKIKKDNVTVELYDRSGLVSVFTPPTLDEWWNVGFVQKLPSGFFQASGPGEDISCNGAFGYTVKCKDKFEFSALDVSIFQGTSPQTTFKGMVFTRYTDGVCNVTGPNIVCDGKATPLEIGAKLLDGRLVVSLDDETTTAKKLWSSTFSPLYLVDNKLTIWLAFQAQNGYLAQVFKLAPTSTDGARETVGDFVRVPCDNCMTLVLRWGGEVADLDIHVFKGESSSILPPNKFPGEDFLSPNDPQRLYWKSALDDRNERQKWGLLYAANDDFYFGPESIVVRNATEVGIYHFVVNPYKATPPQDTVVPASASFSIYTKQGGLTNRLVPPAAVLNPPVGGGGWYVGYVNKTAGSLPTWHTRGALTNKLTNVMTAKPVADTKYPQRR